MKIPKVPFMKWMKALESGEYQQTVDALQDEHGFCCLGVGCKILAKHNKVALFKRFGVLVGNFPKEQINMPKWFQNINEHFAFRKKVYSKGLKLDQLNDDKRYSFKKIAKLLKNAYKDDLV